MVEGGTEEITPLTKCFCCIERQKKLLDSTETVFQILPDKDHPCPTTTFPSETLKLHLLKYGSDTDCHAQAYKLH